MKFVKALAFLHAPFRRFVYGGRRVHQKRAAAGAVDIPRRRVAATAATWTVRGDEWLRRLRRGQSAETSGGDGCDVDSPRRRVAATPRPRPVDSPRRRVAATAATWTVRGDESRRRRGCNVDSTWGRVGAAVAAAVDSLWRRVAATAATWTVLADESRRHSLQTSGRDVPWRRASHRYLDFDSRPCAWSAPSRILNQLASLNVDALLHNQWPAQRALSGDAHFRAEHHSAVAAFRATPATEAALQFFGEAFAHMKLRRDQPALMVALKLARDRLNFTHADVDNRTFCRAHGGRVVSCDAGCLVLHKPMKYFRRADLPLMNRGDAAAATRIFPGEKSRRRRGRDADRPSRAPQVRPGQSSGRRRPRRLRRRRRETRFSGAETRRQTRRVLDGSDGDAGPVPRPGRAALRRAVRGGRGAPRVLSPRGSSSDVNRGDGRDADRPPT